ncbi:MAG TPA: DNA polymerase III subunit chi [Sphingomicrobium sp.]|jgi:DNA polymerase-3 subunit chi|nr:DNA polymerase III subunit chi [Sphingomicrobium sp.]
MQVDFYQLAGTPPEQVIASLAEKLLQSEGRLIVIAEDEGFLARLDRLLWDLAPASFLPHALAGGPDDLRQPILLTTSPDAPNLARNMLIADGKWREAALSYDRSFFLFDDANLKEARAAWKSLATREGVERRYFARQDGKWVKKG